MHNKLHLSILPKLLNLLDLVLDNIFLFWWKDDLTYLWLYLFDIGWLVELVACYCLFAFFCEEIVYVEGGGLVFYYYFLEISHVLAL